MESWQERLKWNIKIFLALLQKDFLIFRLAGLKRRLINNYAWVIMLLYVYQYIGLGPISGCGAYIAAGEVATRGWYSIHNDILKIVYDLRGNRSIDYYLTLPISQTLVLIELMVMSTIKCMILASLVIPVAKLILQDAFPLTALGAFKGAVIFVCAYLFYGAFHLLLASFVDTPDDFNNVRIRISDSFFWLGAYFFTWHKLYAQNWIVAYLDLLNPCVYACEGMRAALLGQAGYLPFWICCIMLLVFAGVVGKIAIHRMKKKLDCLL